MHRLGFHTGTMAAGAGHNNHLTESLNRFMYSFPVFGYCFFFNHNCHHWGLQSPAN